MFTAVHVGLITHSLTIGKTKVSVKVLVSAIHLTGSIGIANTFFCEYRYRYRRYFYKVSLTTLPTCLTCSNKTMHFGITKAKMCEGEHQPRSIEDTKRTQRNKRTAQTFNKAQYSSAVLNDGGTARE